MASQALIWPQQLSFGVKAGVPLTEYFQTGIENGGLRGYYFEYSAATRRYTVGVSTEYRLPRSLGFELDGLYKRMGYVAIKRTFSSTTGSRRDYAIDVKGNSWEFPLLLQYRFRRHTLHPYASGGGVLRYISPVRGRGQVATFESVTQASTLTPIDTSNPAELDRRVYPGVVVAGGIERRAGRLRFLPELRYTRWLGNLSDSVRPLRFFPNQLEVLLGVAF